MQCKIPHFHRFHVDKRNLSVYISYFLIYFLIKGNFSVYLLPQDVVLNHQSCARTTLQPLAHREPPQTIRNLRGLAGTHQQGGVSLAPEHLRFDSWPRHWSIIGLRTGQIINFLAS
ncbi:hypothetical protein SINU_09425 [Sporolactobacillus inulinus CASD]|uniref:Uncharacterized protein n=1 Tax=Sporolactobacillus inulinus CASD TaxID=1069536 RepID=A0A0U1QNH6_9BACL|nr:hypothetical protein SINU_09425 [Sporolactobacillus inulinus CASD]